MFDTTPPTGEFLYQRINQATFDRFDRDEFGDTVLGGVQVDWSAKDFAGTVLGSGSGTTTSYGWVQGQAAFPSGYTGRVQWSGSSPRQAGGTVTDTQLTTAGELTGVFGAVPRSQVGAVTFRPVEPAGDAVCAPLANGAFAAGSLATYRGKLTATLVYSDGVTLKKTFTKDANNYYLDLS